MINMGLHDEKRCVPQQKPPRGGIGQVGEQEGAECQVWGELVEQEELGAPETTNKRGNPNPIHQLTQAKKGGYQSHSQERNKHKPFTQ
eukprot:NODE_5706_length_493_cov_16.281532_g4265_i0.p1 GENE.NODE_5706_length_493_cov_16.281532_g4265_i0~~NODE_5706_length_493_cov_16.281532_g4265_i0.p1  ORF type:complete len:88 (-),score=0.47 NODE_5706_length_493_cov_16.281532_g4265_i0:62-325(-)